MSASEPIAAACPPPLMWQDVRREYLAQSAERVIGPMSVRTIGDGPPLYFLPGFSAPAELFCLMIWLLRDEFRCVTVEPVAASLTRSPPLPSPLPSPLPRGGGEGTKQNLQSEVAPLFAVADELHDDQISIFGADYGAACGLAAASLHPERIERLILLQAFAHRRISFLEQRLIGLGAWSRRTLAEVPLRETIQTQNHRRWFPPFDETRWQYFLDAAGGQPVAELARRARAVMRYDLRAELPRISTPTLLIRTEGDGGVAEGCLNVLEQGIPNAKTEWLHNTGQLAYLTHPHRLAKLVREFTQSSAATRGGS